MYHKTKLKLLNAKPIFSCSYGVQYNKPKQSGSALVIAIFVIIVMSILGAALVSMLNSSQENVAYEVLGTRAYSVAQSGLQWQLSEIFPLLSDTNANNSAVCQNQNEIDLRTPSFNNTNGYEQCSVSVTCTDFVYNSIRYYTIVSTGQCAIGAESTSRTLQIEAHDL